MYGLPPILLPVAEEVEAEVLTLPLTLRITPCSDPSVSMRDFFHIVSVGDGISSTAFRFPDGCAGGSGSSSESRVRSMI